MADVKEVIIDDTLDQAYQAVNNTPTLIIGTQDNAMELVT